MSMTRNHQGFIALAAVGASLLVQQGASDDACTLATGPTQSIIGASDNVPKDIGEIVDVPAFGVHEVTLGATVARGQELTADASSRAVPCAPGAGVNHYYFGFALQSGVVGDRIRYQVARGIKQG
jgi:hypothetical protein